MRRRIAAAVVLGMMLASGPAVFAQAQPNLQKDLNDTGIGEHWVYDDIPKAMAMAKESGKPVLVVFR